MSAGNSSSSFLYLASPGRNIITEARDRSEYDYDVTVSGTDKILTLSTCSYKYGRRKDVRFVVMAKLLEEEMEQVAHLSVPLTAEAHWGKNWLEAKG